MTRKNKHAPPAAGPAGSPQDPDSSGDRDVPAEGHVGSGGRAADDEAAGPPASPAAATSGRHGGEEMDDSGFEEPPRKLWKGERPGEQEDFVHIYQRGKLDDPSVSLRMRHQTGQNEMHPPATLRATEAAAGTGARRSGTDPDYVGEEEFEWEGANARYGGGGRISVLEVTRSRKLQMLRQARGEKPVWRRSRSRKAKNPPAPEAAGRPTPPSQEKASRGAPAKAAAANRRSATSKRPPMPPPPSTHFNIRRINQPADNPPSQPTNPPPRQPTLRMTLRQPTHAAGAAMLLPRGVHHGGRMPAPPPGWKYGLVPIASPTFRPQQQPQQLRAPSRSSPSTIRPLMQTQRQPPRQQHQSQQPPRQQAQRQSIPNPAAGRGGQTPRGQRLAPADVAAHTKTRPATKTTTATNTTKTNKSTPKPMTNGVTTTSEAPSAARGAAANRRGARRGTSGGNPPRGSTPPKEQRPPTQDRGRGARGGKRGAKGGEKRDWRKEREEWNERIMRDYPDHVMAERGRGYGHGFETFIDRDAMGPQPGEIISDLAVRMEELRSGMLSWSDEVMAQAVAAAAQVNSTSTATAQSLPAATPAEEPEEEEGPFSPLLGDWDEDEGEYVVGNEEETEEESGWAHQTLPKSVVEDELELHVDDSERRIIEVDDGAGTSGLQVLSSSTRYEQEEGDEEEEEEDDVSPVIRSRIVEDKLRRSQVGERRADDRPSFPNRPSRAREHLAYALQHWPGAVPKGKKKWMEKQLEQEDARSRMRRARGDPDSEEELDQEEMRARGSSRCPWERRGRGGRGGGGGRGGRGKGKGKGKGKR